MDEDDQFKKTLPLQEAFEFIQEEQKLLKNLSLAQIQLHKLTLRAFLDLELVELEPLTNALRELANRHDDSDQTKDLFLGMITSFEESHGQSEAHPDTPHLRIVHKTDDPD